MMQLEQIQAEIEQLSQDEFIELRRWFAEKDWELWDEQLGRDITAGKLDFLLEEARLAKTNGRLREL